MRVGAFIQIPVVELNSVFAAIRRNGVEVRCCTANGNSNRAICGFDNIRIGCFHTDCAGRHYEGGGCAACVRKGDASVLYNPLIKHLTSRSIICDQGNLRIRYRLVYLNTVYCRLTVCYGNGVPCCKLYLENNGTT